MQQIQAVQPRQLFLTVLASVLLGSLALLLFVLPAEYGIDPTGLGKKLGIQRMSEYSVSALSTENAPPRQDYVEFPLSPFQSIEYKYELKAGQSMQFSWQAQAEVVFDFHSEEVGTDPEDSVSFAVGRAANQHGTYVAPYDGIHGWFWENRGQQEVTVKLTTNGYFKRSITFSPAGEYERTF